MSNRAQIQGFPTRAASLEQVSGDGKGQLHELSSDKATLGRAEDNDIVIQNDGVSRLHAMLIFSEGAWFIRDNQSKNGIIVNGKQVRESWLENGDIVQIGASVFKFNETVVAEAESAAAPSFAISSDESVDPIGGGFAAAPTTTAKKGLSKRVYIYAGVALVLVGLFVLTGTENGEKKDGAVDPETGEKLARDFKTGEEPNLKIDRKDGKIIGMEDPILKKAEQEMTKLDWTNGSLRESEQFFRRGQREYLNHSYHRAIESFQTALSLYRGHVLAERYLRRTVYEVEIEAKKNMQTGVQYFEALQYQRAMYHFTETIALMAHRPGEPIIAEAERYIQQCKKRLQAAELFP